MQTKCCWYIWYSQRNLLTHQAFAQEVSLQQLIYYFVELILQWWTEKTFSCRDVTSKGRCTTTRICDIPNKAAETCTRGSFKSYRKASTGFHGQQLVLTTSDKPNIPSFCNCFCLCLAKMHFFHLLQVRDGYNGTSFPHCLKSSLLSSVLLPYAKLNLYLHLCLLWHLSWMDMRRTHDTSPII